MWRQLTSKEIFHHPRLTLIEDDVLLPDGQQTKYLRYKDDGSSIATLICKKSDDMILFQKEYSYPINKVLIQLPGGGVNPEETPEQGANRELMEEMGLKGIKPILLGSYLYDNRRSAKQCYVFLVEETVDAKLSGDKEENIEAMWILEKDVPQLIAKGDIINIHTLASWSLYQAYLANHL